MQKVLSAAEMREVDRLTTERYGIPSIILMENAANAVAKVITDKLGGSVEDKRILILCGKGNNGGDGAAIGRILWKEGAIVEIELHADLNDVVGDARTNFEAVRELESWPRYVGRGQPPDQLYFRQPNPDKYLNWTNTTGFEIGSFDVLVDAMFGTGLSRGLDKEYSYVSDFRSLRDGMRLSKPLIVSVDIPSGLTSDFGYIEGPHVSADLTVTFTAPKQGNIVAPAARHNGVHEPHVHVLVPPRRRRELRQAERLGQDREQ